MLSEFGVVIWYALCSAHRHYTCCTLLPILSTIHSVSVFRILDYFYILVYITKYVKFDSFLLSVHSLVMNCKFLHNSFLLMLSTIIRAMEKNKKQKTVKY